MTPYFQDDAVTIYHGDCREIVPTLGRFDLLLTDPPYGVDFAGKHAIMAPGWQGDGRLENTALWIAIAPAAAPRQPSP